MDPVIPALAIAIAFVGVWTAASLLRGTGAVTGFHAGPVPTGTSFDEFRGGLRWRWANATYPLATLRVSDDYVVLRSFIVPTSEAFVRRDEVLAVAVVRRLAGVGFRVLTADGRCDGAIFWSWSEARVREALARHGWPVEYGDRSSRHKRR